MKYPVVGTLIPSDRYHFVVVRREDGTTEEWLLTAHDRERLRERALRFDGPLPVSVELPAWKRVILGWLGAV